MNRAEVTREFESDIEGELARARDRIKTLESRIEIETTKRRHAEDELFRALCFIQKHREPFDLKRLPESATEGGI